MKSKAPDEFITRTEAAALVRVHPATIARWQRWGILPASRVGPRFYRYKKQDVLSLLGEKQIKPS